MNIYKSRIKTGISGFDKVINGGFKEDSINLVCGGAGSGKTIFSIQFLMEGLKMGEPGIYITFEESKKKLYSDMADLGWDLEMYEERGLFKFLEYTPEQIKKVIVESGGTMETIILKTGARRMVIDSISAFSMLFRDDLIKKQSSLQLFKLINEWGCTAVVTSDAIQRSPDDLVAQMQFEVDSIVILHHFKKEGVRQRGIEVLKMRGTKIPEKTMKMDISKNGIKLEPNKIVSVN